MAHINVTYTWTMSTQIKKQKHGAHSNTYKVRISANFMERFHFYVRHTQNTAKLKATKTTINLQNEEKNNTPIETSEANNIETILHSI